MKNFHTLEVNGGRVICNQSIRFELPPTESGYTNAQIDDYGGRQRRNYPWQKSTGAMLTLQARFSHPANELSGTAGFGFWNAPYGDTAARWPALPQATWFFMSAPPGDLPLNPHGPGQGFFASTVDATTLRAISMSPLTLPVILLNRFSPFRQTVWPKVQQRLGMSYQQIDQIDITQWNRYGLIWNKNGCTFSINEQIVLVTPQSPRGPLGFVCWIDNQFMQVTPTGRVSAGIVGTKRTQRLEINDLNLHVTNRK
jgi:hypothetical protein